MDILPSPQEQAPQMVAPDPDMLALFVFRLRKHPYWQHIIRLKINQIPPKQGAPKPPPFEDSKQLVEWLSLPMDRKREREVEKAYSQNRSAFIKQNWMIFNSWPWETKDAVARMVLFFQTRDPSVLEKPELIHKVTR